MVMRIDNDDSNDDDVMVLVIVSNDGDDDYNNNPNIDKDNYNKIYKVCTILKMT